MTAEGRDAFPPAVAPIANQDVHVGVGAAILHAGAVGARKALGSDPLGSTTATLDLTPGTDQWE